MGGTTSKSLSQKVIDTTVEKIKDISQSCSVNVSSDQLFDISDIGGNLTINDLKLTQISTISISCMLSDDKLTRIVDQLKNSILTNVNNKSTMSLIANSTASIENHVIDRFSTIDIAKLRNDVVANLANNQTVKIANVSGNVLIKNIDISQQAFAVVETIIQNAELSDFIKEIETVESNEAKNKEQSIIGEVFSGISENTNFFFMLLIGGCCLVALFMFYR